jgi:hypothetical protein
VRALSIRNKLISQLLQSLAFFLGFDRSPQLSKVFDVNETYLSARIG